MAGRKQHYIPQCLLKGFEAPSKGTTKKVWVFKKGQRPYVSPTQDVAAERHFYSGVSKDGALTLDDRITQYENDLAQLLNLLREAPLDGIVDATIAAEVITHLTIRAAHLRDVFSLGLKQLIAGGADIFTNKEYMRTLLGIDAVAPTPLFQEQIEKLLCEQADLLAKVGLPKPLLIEVAFTLVKENFNRFHADHSPVLMGVFNEMARNVRSIARIGHTKALATSLMPDARMAVLSQLVWTICTVPAGDLILPDCVAVGMQSDSSIPEPYMMNSLDKTDVVLLPVCANRLLIGHRGDAKLPDVQRFNEVAAACSHTFFVSAWRTAELERLTERIRERSNATVLDVVACTLNEITTKSSVVEQQSQSVPQSIHGQVSSEATIAMVMEQTGNREPHDAQELSYPLTFLDCADQGTAQEIAAAVNVVVFEMSHWMPLRRLDHITFARDYGAALRDMDRGFSASVPLVPAEADFGVGVAMAPLVLRDGVVKVCIVMQAWLGHALIGKDRDAKTIATHTLASQLAHVACVDLIDQALPGMLLSRVDDDWEAWLYVHMHEAWTAYFSARISAGFNPGMDSGYRDILLAVLERTKETIPRERLSYRVHGDLDRFLGLAISSIGTVMNYAGMLLGHCDGLCQSVYDEGGALTQALQGSGLHAWFDGFRRDLARLFDRRGQWESVEEFLVLNRHIERVLWQFGVFPWRNEEGHVRVEIPLGIDAAQLLKG